MTCINHYRRMMRYTELMSDRSNIVSFDAARKLRKKQTDERAKRRILCDNNHHKWVVVKSTEFDVKSGKLVTIEKCSRCGETRSRLW